MNPEHFRYSEEDGVATVCLDRPDRLNALTFDSYAELRDAFLEGVLACDDAEIRAQAYRVAAAWAPHDYLDRAAEDESDAIRDWAAEELKTLKL